MVHSAYVVTHMVQLVVRVPVMQPVSLWVLQTVVEPMLTVSTSLGKMVIDILYQLYVYN